jgi:hypothetical protein
MMQLLVLALLICGWQAFWCAVNGSGAAFQAMQRYAKLRERVCAETGAAAAVCIHTTGGQQKKNRAWRSSSSTAATTSDAAGVDPQPSCGAHGASTSTEEEPKAAVGGLLLQAHREV